MVEPAPAPTGALVRAKPDTFDPAGHPGNTIFRVLDGGEDAAVRMRATFAEEQIRTVLRSERRLPRKPADFRALVCRIPPEEGAALAPDGTSGVKPGTPRSFAGGTGLALRFGRPAPATWNFFACDLPFARLAGVAIADPCGITCMRISAIVSRGAKRDFIDLYAAAQRFGLGPDAADARHSGEQHSYEFRETSRFATLATWCRLSPAPPARRP